MPSELKERTFQFSLRILRLVENLPSTFIGSTFGHQILRCSTSVGANYRAACRAKSDRDFLNKMKICEEEIDETLYWLDLIKHANLFPDGKLDAVISEANELCAIITAICKTTASKIQDKKFVNRNS